MCGRVAAASLGARGEPGALSCEAAGVSGEEPRERAALGLGAGGRSCRDGRGPPRPFRLGRRVPRGIASARESSTGASERGLIWKWVFAGVS